MTISARARPALLFDLYGVLLNDQPASSLAAIEEAAGQSGPEFWACYWGYRPAYDRGEVSSQDYWQAIGSATGTPIRDVDAAISADLDGWLDADAE
ncbi:MAG: hypothetical protein Q4B08_15800, partial [Propionibacteriaceae bacterium]|nr:hypothetical protein [Propionibacteriaceae bacterium]